jgi:hypothetical protein
MTTPVEIRLANISTPTDVISDEMSRYLVNKIVCLPFVVASALPIGTPTKLARKDGALGLGVTVNEAADYTHDNTNSIFTQTDVSLTAIKTVISSKISVEAMQFAGVTDQQIIDKQANSIGRTLDNAVKLLADGFTQFVDAGATMTAEALLEAVMLISAGNASTDNQAAVAFLSPKQILQLQKQLVQSGGSAWSNISMLSLLQTLEQPNGYAGSLPGGVDVYRVNGLPTGGGNTIGCVINPELAFYGMYGDLRVERDNPNSQGLCTELTTFVFNQVAEWNDAAGVEVQSDT